MALLTPTTLKNSPKNYAMGTRRSHPRIARGCWPMMWLITPAIIRLGMTPIWCVKGTGEIGLNAFRKKRHKPRFPADGDDKWHTRQTNTEREADVA